MSIIYDHRDADGDQLALRAVRVSEGFAVAYSDGVYVTIQTLEEMLEAARKYERKNRHRIALEEIRDAILVGPTGSEALAVIKSIVSDALEGSNE